MVGKIHKKKISEYTEAAEHEENRSDIEGGDDDMVDKEYRGSGSDSENGDLGNNDNNKSFGSVGIRDDDEETTLGEDDAAQNLNLDSHDEADDKVGTLDDFGDDDEVANKKTKKRKSAAGKKSFDDDETDDEALNGVTPKKKGRKQAGGKTATKGASKAKAKPKKPAPVDEDDDEDDGEEEEEYEVKDIVGHKTERGVSYFLIRWKGYTKADDTWEAENTLNCPEIIDKYKKKQRGTNTPKKVATPAAKKGKASAVAAKGSKKQEPEEEWEVDKIIDYAEEKKGRVFRIRWKGFGPKHDTWEPEQNLNCRDIIDKFLKKMKSEENLSFKELREEPKKTKRLVNETAPRTNIHNPIGRTSKRGGKKSDSPDRSSLTPAILMPPMLSPPTYSNAKTSSRVNGMRSAAADSTPSTNIFGMHSENASFLNHVDWVLKQLPSTTAQKMQARIFAILYDELGGRAGAPKRKGL